MTYNVRFAHVRPDLQCDWDSEAWRQAEYLEISNFRPEGSSHKPKTQVKLLYDHDGIFGIFRVEDRYIRSVWAKYGDPVYKDSCVEFFVQPKPGSGYFNFEFNCGGALLCNYITDHRRTESGFREYVRLPEDEGRQVKISHTMPQVVEPEISGPAEWLIEFSIPFSVLEKYTGPVGSISGQSWRANFYKCADETSHPHWAAWSPVRERNFHLPECFGTILFE